MHNEFALTFEKLPIWLRAERAELTPGNFNQ